MRPVHVFILRWWKVWVWVWGASNTISVIVPRSTIRLALAAWAHIGHIARKQTARIVAIHRMVSRFFVFNRTLMLRGAVFCIAR